MRRDRTGWRRALFAAAGAGLLLAGAVPALAGDGSTPGAGTLEETRAAMEKWIQTQQIIAKERNDWQQGREILSGRIDLVKKEIATLEQGIAEAKKSAGQGDQKRGELQAQIDVDKAADAQLVEAVTKMEAQLRERQKSLPDFVLERLKPLFQRMPADPATTKVSAAERYQNVLGILNDLNKVSNDITVNYEVHKLADGKPSEVRAIYVGLTQAYYLSSGGEAGIGRPTPDGWRFEPANAIAEQVAVALDVLQGKHSPTFVALPVKLK
jgi:hypothetical protein